jgi:hypothetical protein
MMLSLVRVIAVFTLLTLFASAQDVRTADLILRHGAIYTMDAARSWAEAVAIACGANLAGGVTGSLLAGFFLLRWYDVTVATCVAVGVNIAEVFEEIDPGSEITLLVARNNEPVELSGRYQPQLVTPLPRQLFDRTLPSGRVDLSRSGNTVTATTRGVTGFTLLLSPDQFDFGKPVKVVANGGTVFDKKVEKNLRTLLKWAALDNDRTMLFGAEVHIELAR